MNNKVAYITGGTKGIGFGIAKEMLKKGIKVAVSGRKLEDAEKAAAELSEFGEIIGICSDVRNLESEQAAIAKTVSEFGQLDIVIANAGLGIFKPVDQLSPEEWNQMIDTNLTGVYHTLKAAVEELKKSKGYFISIASLAGTNFFENGSGYNAS